jgi:lysyl-tRNA synthetase class II
MFVDCEKGNLLADVVERIDLAVRANDHDRIEELVVELGYLQPKGANQMDDKNNVHEIKFEPARFPPDFIGAVADGAESVLCNYLRENSPKLHKLFNAYVCLTDYKANAQARQTIPMMNEDVADYLSQVTCILAELRHSFRSQGDGEEYTPHLDWVEWYTGNGGK